MQKQAPQAPRTTLSRKRIVPLKGLESFTALMRTRPLAAWGQCMVHALIKPIQPIGSQTRIELGLIVPKKAYQLAVDRNRIRRVLRAQCLEAAQTLPCSVQLLFRIKPSPKKASPGKTASSAALVNKNPHSAEFTAAIKQGLSSAFATLNAPNEVNLP
jgi:ribonuclease P protein component